MECKNTPIHAFNLNLDEIIKFYFQVTLPLIVNSILHYKKFHLFIRFMLIRQKIRESKLIKTIKITISEIEIFSFSIFFKLIPRRFIHARI